MRAVLNRKKLGVLGTGGALLLMASAGVSADLLTFSASQGGKHTVLSTDLGETISEADLANRSFAGNSGTLNIPRYVPSMSTAINSALSNFLAGLSGVQTRTFEGDAGDTGATVTPNGSGQVFDGEDGSADSSLGKGRYNITGIQQGTAVLRDAAGHWYEDAFTFTVAVPTGTNALGFFGIDFGDLEGGLALELLDTSGANIFAGTPNASISVPSSSTAGSATLLFFGLHSDTTFASVKFTITQANDCNSQDPAGCDFLGFDNITTGAKDTGGNGTVPEPGTLALLGLGLAGLAATRRRRQ